MKVVCAALLLGACSHAQLHHTNRVIAALAVVVTSCDAGQTEYAATYHGNAGSFTETNPVLGPHPSTFRVGAYFGAVLSAAVLSAIYLPDWAVPVVNGAIAIAGVDSIRYNSTAGVEGPNVPITCGIENR